MSETTINIKPSDKRYKVSLWFKRVQSDIAFWMGITICILGFLFGSGPEDIKEEAPLNKNAFILSLIGLMISFVAVFAAMGNKYKNMKL